MNPSIQNQTPQDDQFANAAVAEDEEQDSQLTYWLTAAFGVAVAVVCFTPLWDEIAKPEARGRRAGLSRLLADIGSVPIAIAGVLLAIVFGTIAIRQRKPAQA